MARPTGRSPGRYTTEKLDGVPHRKVAHCAGCDTQMLELKLPTLHYWQPEFKHVRKYPFTEPTFFCDDCRVEYELPHDHYVLVPMAPDQTLQQALLALLESLQGATDAPNDPADPPIDPPPELRV